MKKQTFFGRWMQNSYLLFVFALVISLVVWVYMSFNSPNTETTFTIGDVPIQIELSEEARNQGLQAFTVDDPKATVTVSGNRTVLGLVNENDLSVTASAAAATTTGTFTLPVTANKRTARANFQITASTPSNINVMIDYLKDRNGQKDYAEEIDEEGLVKVRYSRKGYDTERYSRDRRTVQNTS